MFNNLKNLNANNVNKKNKKSRRRLKNHQIKNLLQSPNQNSQMDKTYSKINKNYYKLL